MTLKNKIKRLPDSPGIYRFLDSKSRVLYIGRATSLKKRVAQYFRKDLDPRISEMVAKAQNVKFRKTETVLDSVIVEANEIKKHWPKYNVKDKDNRSFVYVVIPKVNYSNHPRPSADPSLVRRGNDHDGFTYPLIVRERDLRKFPEGQNRLFGPYQSATLAKNALKIIRRIFPYGTCKPNQGKPCFDYQIGLCPGGCIGEIDKKDYQENIKGIVMLLSGQKKRLLNKLKKENPEQAKALKHLQDVTLITSDEIDSTRGINRIEAYDISHLTGRETYGAMAVFIDGKPDKAEYRLFKIKEAPAGDDLKALLEMIIRRFNHPEWSRPDFILIDGGKPQVDFIAKIFDHMNISIPFVGVSKFAGDKLVFPAKTKKQIKDLAISLKKILLEIRDEAHRFGHKASRNCRNKKMKIKK